MKPSPNVPEGERPDGDRLPPHGEPLPATERLALLLGQLLPTPLLAQGSSGVQPEVEVVEDLGAVGHRFECIASFGG